MGYVFYTFISIFLLYIYKDRDKIKEIFAMIYGKPTTNTIDNSAFKLKTKKDEKQIQRLKYRG